MSIDKYLNPALLATVEDWVATSPYQSQFLQLSGGNNAFDIEIDFDFCPIYGELERGEITHDGIESVDVKTVKFIVNDQPVCVISFELSGGSDLHEDWCKAVLPIAQDRDERILSFI